MELMTGKLKLHSELIDALHGFVSQSNTEGLFESRGKSREIVVEQALVEQNQILDVMQELISTLESENRHSRDTINKQGRIISSWEVKSKQSEKELAGLRSKSQDLSLKKDDPQITDLKKQLIEKEQTILSLRSQFKHESVSLLAAKLSSIKTMLEIERVRCIELEEELSQVNGKVTQLNIEANLKESAIISKESEIMHLKHEMESLRNLEQQQQDLVLKQRATLSSKDVQLMSLTRALDKEKKVADQLRRIQCSSRRLSYSPGVINEIENTSYGEIPEVQCELYTSLFEQIAGCTTHSAQLTRTIPETELGFSFTKVDLPDPSRVPCLIVKAVKAKSLADGVLQAGDKLLEVNRILCQSLQQSRAVHVLEKGVGVLKIVVARTLDYPSLPNKMILSTPTKLMDCLSNSGVSTSWDTALHSPNATFQSFSVETSLVAESQNDDAEFVMVPETNVLTVTRDSSDDQVVDVLATNISLHNQEPGGEKCPTPTSISSVNESESLIVGSSRDEVSVKIFQIADLQNQLDESEQIRLNFESILNATCEELDQIKNESKAVMSENEEYLQQLFSRDSEINDIQQYISELQTSLVALQSGVVDDQQKIGSLENQNRIICGELIEVKHTSAQVAVMKDSLEEEVLDLKSELKKRDKKESEGEMILCKQTLENTRLTSDAVRMESELEKLRNSLDSSRQVYEETLAGMKQECQQMQSKMEAATEMSEKTKISSQEQYEYLSTQLKSAKSQLMEAEVNDSQVQVELQYLKQAANQANRQFEKVEADYHIILEELRYFRQEAERTTLEIESMKVGLKGAQIKLDAKHQMTTRIQTELDNSRRINAKLRNEATHMKDLLKEAELDLKASTAEEERVGKKLQTSIDEKNELFEQLEKSFEESTELSLKVQELVVELKELKEENVSDSKNTNKELVKSLKIFEARLQGELESSQKKTGILTDQLSRMKSEIKIVQQQWEDTEKELKQARSQKEHLTANKDELSKELAEMQERHSDLHNRLDSKQQALDETKSTLMQLQEQVRIDKEHSADHMARILELELELEQVQSAKKQAIDMVASLKFIQKQNQEKLEQAEQFLREKEKNSRTMSEQIDHVKALIQQSNLEQEALTTSMTSLKQELKENQRIYARDLKGLKEELSLKEKKLMQIGDEFESHRSKSEMLDGKAEYLAESMGKLIQKRYSLEKALVSSVKETRKLQNLNQKLQGVVDRLKAELKDMLRSSDSLSSESAGLRQQLQQNNHEVDKLTVQLHATELNLEVALKTILENKKVSTAQSEKLESLKKQCKETHSKMEDFSTHLESSSLELCKRDEELSKLRTTLELRQQDSDTLQGSLVAMQNIADNARKRVQEFDMEHCTLLSTISDLRIEKKMAQEFFDKRINIEQTQKKLEIEKYQADIEALWHKEKEHVYEVDRLNGDNQVLEKSLNELISAQEEMRISISKIGNEKDIEIIKLHGKAKTLTRKCDDVQEQYYSIIKREKVLKEHMLEMEKNVTDLEELVEKEKSCNEDLKSEIEVHQITAQGIQKLNEKVTFLNEGLRGKTKRLSELEQIHNSILSELRKMQIENKALLENVSELVTLKLSVVDQAEAINYLKRKLTEKEVTYEHILNERDHMVKELEVITKHTSKNSKQLSPTSAIVTGSTCHADKEKEELLQIIRQKEDEVLRTSEYMEQLLISVMIKAPSLLEK